VRRSDPLANPTPLIRRTYSYVAYRIGDGPDAEDVTSTAIERAVRYRASFDPRKGEPLGWVLGIARGCIADHRRNRRATSQFDESLHALGDLEGDAERRLSVRRAVATLDERDRELVALRYGADLTTREIGRLLGMQTNAVDVALHRCRGRLRVELERLGYGVTSDRGRPLARPASEPST
jgi:RNA polymerase sigma-70 factor (ECF subfamily)